MVRLLCFAALLVSRWVGPAHGQRSIGASLPFVIIDSADETTVFMWGDANASSANPETAGYLNHLWVTEGCAEAPGCTVYYYVDHEANASLSYEILGSAAIGWEVPSASAMPQQTRSDGSGAPLSGGEPWQNSLFGKTGARGGLWNSFKVPFQFHIHVTMRSNGPHPVRTYVNVKGTVGAAQFAVGDAPPILLSSRPRLRLTHTTMRLRPFEFIPIFRSPPQRKGMVMLVFQKVECANRHFTEGCLRAYRNDRAEAHHDDAHAAMSPPPPLHRNDYSNYSYLISSGVEDYFDSGYHWTGMGWPVPLYHGENAGLTHWNLNHISMEKMYGIAGACSGAAAPSTATSGNGSIGTCRLAAYKLHHHDHIFYDGTAEDFELVWRNGELYRRLSQVWEA